MGAESKHFYKKEPIIHSHITDCLPDDHPLVEVSVYCTKCNDMLHSEPPNECMQTWIETEFGNYCAHCWHLTDILDALERNLK